MKAEDITSILTKCELNTNDYTIVGNKVIIDELWINRFSGLLYGLNLDIHVRTLHAHKRSFENSWYMIPRCIKSCDVLNTTPSNNFKSIRPKVLDSLFLVVSSGTLHIELKAPNVSVTGYSRGILGGSIKGNNITTGGSFDISNLEISGELDNDISNIRVSTASIRICRVIKSLKISNFATLALTTYKPIADPYERKEGNINISNISYLEIDNPSDYNMYSKLDMSDIKHLKVNKVYMSCKDKIGKLDVTFDKVFNAKMLEFSMLPDPDKIDTGDKVYFICDSFKVGILGKDTYYTKDNNPYSFIKCLK